MAKAQGLTVSESEISQTFDLDKIAGAKISSDPALRNQIAQAIVDYMIGRVQLDNLGIDRKPWKAKSYSKSYVNSQDFEAAGKSEDSVDLTLSGDMLGSVDITKQSKGLVTISITDKSALPRAYGHMTGFEGHPTIPPNKYKREFFGVSDKEIKDQVLQFFSDEINALSGE